MKIVILFGLLPAVLNVPAASKGTIELQKLSDSTEVKKSNSSETKIYTFVDQPPQMPGGEREVYQFINKHLRISKAMKKTGVSGKVWVRFVVNEDGKVSDPEVIRNLDPAFDKEALRITKLIPKFKPGRQNGKPVKVYFNMPIIFKKT